MLKPVVLPPAPPESSVRLLRRPTSTSTRASFMDGGEARRRCTTPGVNPIGYDDAPAQGLDAGANASATLLTRDTPPAGQGVGRGKASYPAGSGAREGGEPRAQPVIRPGWSPASVRPATRTTGSPRCARRGVARGRCVASSPAGGWGLGAPRRRVARGWTRRVSAADAVDVAPPGARAGRRPAERLRVVHRRDTPARRRPRRRGPPRLVTPSPLDTVAGMSATSRRLAGEPRARRRPRGLMGVAAAEAAQFRANAPSRRRGALGRETGSQGGIPGAAGLDYGAAADLIAEGHTRKK